MIINKEGCWKFDSIVAENFSQIARTSIPDYDRVINLAIKIANKVVEKKSKILDVGSAIGHTLECFYNEWYYNIFWVDSSDEMLKRSFNKATLIKSDIFPAEYGKFNYITANWTLHFIIDRKKYIELMFESLEEGGYIFISEKITSSIVCSEMYNDFKYDMWLTKKQITDKEKSIKGVLVTNSIEWYIDIFRQVWFSSIDIVNAYPSFCSFLLKK